MNLKFTWERKLNGSIQQQLMGFSHRNVHCAKFVKPSKQPFFLLLKVVSSQSVISFYYTWWCGWSRRQVFFFFSSSISTSSLLPPLSSVIDSVSQSYEVSQSVFLLVVLLFPSRSRGLLFLHNLLSQWIVSTQLTLTIFGLLLTTTSARPTCPRALLLTD